MEREEFLIQWTNYEKNKATNQCNAFLIDNFIYIESNFFEKPIFSGTGIIIPFDILNIIIQKLKENNIEI